MCRQFLRTISQNTEYVKTHCIDLYSRFHFACQKWAKQQNNARNVLYFPIEFYHGILHFFLLVKYNFNMYGLFKIFFFHYLQDNIYEYFQSFYFSMFFFSTYLKKFKYIFLAESNVYGSVFSIRWIILYNRNWY